jgi:hypothetical protein
MPHRQEDRGDRLPKREAVEGSRSSAPFGCVPDARTRTGVTVSVMWAYAAGGASRFATRAGAWPRPHAERHPSSRRTTSPRRPSPRRGSGAPIAGTRGGLAGCSLRCGLTGGDPPAYRGTGLAPASGWRHAPVWLPPMAGTSDGLAAPARPDRRARRSRRGKDPSLLERLGFCSDDPDGWASLADPLVVYRAGPKPAPRGRSRLK